LRRSKTRNKEKKKENEKMFKKVLFSNDPHFLIFWNLQKNFKFLFAKKLFSHTRTKGFIIIIVCFHFQFYYSFFYSQHCRAFYECLANCCAKCCHYILWFKESFWVKNINQCRNIHWKICFVTLNGSRHAFYLCVIFFFNSLFSFL
jgi:hypothetical protein